jgi:hypothetical protein
LKHGKQALAIVSIDNHTADRTKEETRCSFAETRIPNAHADPVIS